MPYLMVALLLTFAMIGEAVATDAPAKTGPAGPRVRHSNVVELRDADVFVSANDVIVRYRFFNASDDDVEMPVVVSFPGALDLMHYEQEMDVPPGRGGRVRPVFESLSIPKFREPPTGDPREAMAFETTVQGLPIQVHLDQRAIQVQWNQRGRRFFSKDRTNLLRRHGIPPDTRSLDLFTIPVRTRGFLESSGLLFVRRGYDSEAIFPLWRVETRLYWRQRFRAGRDVHVAHRYAPLLGNCDDEWEACGREPDEEPILRYCPTAEFISKFEHLWSADVRRYRKPPSFQVVAVKLGNIARWKGPVREFRLVVDKGSVGTLMATCFPGLKPTGPTRFQAHLTDFEPDADLLVFFVDPGDPLPPAR